VRHRGEEGAVGLDEQPFQWHDGRAARTSSAFLKVMIPLKETNMPLDAARRLGGPP